MTAFIVAAAPVVVVVTDAVAAVVTRRQRGRPVSECRLYYMNTNRAYNYRYNFEYVTVVTSHIRYEKNIDSARRHDLYVHAIAMINRGLQSAPIRSETGSARKTTIHISKKIR